MAEETEVPVVEEKKRAKKPTMAKVFHYKNQTFAGQVVKIPETSVNPNQVYTLEELEGVVAALKEQGIETDILEKF